MEYTRTFNMESILTSFHLDIETFGQLLEATGGVLAGSAAAAAYMAETPYTFEPNDLDIWVHSDIPLDDPHRAPVRHAYEFLFAQFLRQHGYVEVLSQHQSDEEYTSNPVFAILSRIQRFQHGTGRIVQVMHCRRTFGHVLNTFDLSVASTWWKPMKGRREGFLDTVCSHSLRQGRMYSRRPPTNDREIARIEKYKAWGFTLEEKSMAHDW